MYVNPNQTKAMLIFSEQMVEAHTQRRSRHEMGREDTCTDVARVEYTAS